MNKFTYDPIKRKYVIKYNVSGHEVITYMPSDSSIRELNEWQSYHFVSCRHLILEKITNYVSKITKPI